MVSEIRSNFLLFLSTIVSSAVALVSEPNTTPSYSTQHAALHSSSNIAHNGLHFTHTYTTEWQRSKPSSFIPTEPSNIDRFTYVGLPQYQNLQKWSWSLYIPPHLKHFARLHCEILLSASEYQHFMHIYFIIFSWHVDCGQIFCDHCIANLLLSVSLQEI